MHDFIPILPCDDTEENGDSLARCGEVGVPAIRGDGQNQLYKDVLYCIYCTKPAVIISRNKQQNEAWSINRILTGWCSLRIWPFQRERRRQTRSRGEGGTCPRWWRSSCTCWLPQSTAASSESPLFITYTHAGAHTFRGIFCCHNAHSFPLATLRWVCSCTKQYTHMLPTYCKEPEDDHTCAHHIGICILEGKMIQLHVKDRNMIQKTFPWRDVNLSNQQGKVQHDPDDTQWCDQQVIAIPPALPVTRRRHGYQLHGHLGNNTNT